MDDFQGNQEADVVANLGAAEHAPHEPSADYLFWVVVAKAVRHFWRYFLGLALAQNSQNEAATKRSKYSHRARNISLHRQVQGGAHAWDWSDWQAYNFQPDDGVHVGNTAE
eukprot:4686802-Amphidinium_carterae.1